MNSVFILGAGASDHAGVPMMSTFLEVVEDIARKRKADHFQLVVDGRAELQAVHTKARFDLWNLETVFTAFEMAELFGTLGELPADKVSELTKAMRQVIVETIETRMTFEVSKTNHIVPPSEYNRFAALLGLLAANDENISVMTFNYDIGLDIALDIDDFLVDYCLLPQQPVVAQLNGRMIELMKLHGSINWTSCVVPSCGHVVVEHPNTLLAREVARLRTGPRAPGEKLLLHPSAVLSSLSHCDRPCASSPMIVPPTGDKGGLRRPIEYVWKRAAARLREADNIFVIGYSWPDTDQFFHQLYAIGSVGKRVLRRFWVFDPNEEVRSKFQKRLLGQQALERFGPSPQDLQRVGNPGDLRFSSAIETIGAALGVTPDAILRRANRTKPRSERRYIPNSAWS